MEPLNRFQKWIQQTFFGSEHDRETEEKETTETRSNKIERKPNYSSYQEPSDHTPRITYQYAKSSGVRFPEEMEEQAKEMMNDRKVDETKWEKKVKAETAQPKGSQRVQYPDQEEVLEEKKERVKFNNPDFKPTSIPSPIHGFRKVTPSQRTQLTLHNTDDAHQGEARVTGSWLRERQELNKRLEDSVFEKLRRPVPSLSEWNNEPEQIDVVEDIQVHDVVPVETDQGQVETYMDIPAPNELAVSGSDAHDEYDLIKEQAPQEDAISQNDQTVEVHNVPVLDEVDILPKPEPETVDSHEVQMDESAVEVVVEEPIIDDSDLSNESSTLSSQTVEVEPVEETEVTEPEQVVTAPIKTTAEEQGKPKSTSKPSIPFNVLMMPKDKQVQPAQKIKQDSNDSYQKPGIQLLRYPEAKRATDTEWLEEQAMLLEETLQSFHVDAKVVHTTMGPSVTRYEIQPARGVKVNKVTNLSDDIKMALSAKEIRIEAPIPGKNTIGIEVPNLHPEAVWLREILRRDVFIKPDSPMTVALGLDISGQPIVTDLRKMPHGLVAGATGSGKSVCINSILISLLYKANPDEVKLLLVDPKMVELAPYNDVPHLVAPVITDAKQATIALKWVVGEMERRYEQFSQKGVRDVGRYNELYSDNPSKPAMPYILVVIDELADLMMVAPQDVEDSICRIAQKARACGIHLLVATQRPSVDVITGLIKANIPTRIAFSVSSQTDSRTILDMNGAERLLGRGDMLFNENGSPKPVRVQGTFVTDEEIEDVIAHVKKQRKPEFLLDTEQMQKTVEQTEQEDELFEEACYHVINQGNASASNLQRRFRIGYNRAARLIDMLEARGVITGAMGSKPRQVLIDEMSVDKVLGYTD
ncbi:DNA translocase FtsK [Alkalihalobacillus sp. NPDC078783]